MSFRLGLVGLCSSHPGNWVPIIRELVSEGLVDCQVNAVWDSAETRPKDFAKQFSLTHEIPHCVDKLEEMLPLVDGIILHTANWDRHIEQAEIFVNANKSIFIDKPIIGNNLDAAKILDWIQQGARIIGGSALRFTAEVKALHEELQQKNEHIHTVYSAAGVDDFNYAIHSYALISDLMGPGIISARHFDSSEQKQILLKYKDNRSAIISVGESAGLPFNFTAASHKGVYQLSIDNSRIYHNLLKVVLPYLCDNKVPAPFTGENLLEPELAAMAARVSWLNHGQEVFLDDLHLDAPGYDGDLFASIYRRNRISPPKKT